VAPGGNKGARGEQSEFTWTMDIGEDGVDDDPINPLSRSLDCLLRTGQPLQKMALCFCSLPGKPSEPARLRWLGAFVFSAGERVIFFPGYAVMPDTLLGVRDQAKMWDSQVGVDHLSLEKDRASWHATTPMSKRHFGGPTTLDLAGGKALWFGMSVADGSALRPAKKRTLVQASVPPSDSRRRADVFREAREAMNFPIVTPKDAPGFFHFSFIVGPVGFPTYVGCEHGFPRGSPFLVTPLPDYMPGVAASMYCCRLEPCCDLQVTVMRLPGTLTVPMTITSPGTRQTIDPS
jgi:hypothetical protein